MSRDQVGIHSTSKATTLTMGSRETRWSKPLFGFKKINTDVAWFKKSSCMGVGWVCRDFVMLLQAARGSGSGSGLCHSVAAVEAYAIQDAILACSILGFDKVIIESDAKMIIQMLRKEVPIDFSLDCILGDIEVLARRLTSVTFEFVSRECNFAAHSVAKYVLKDGRDFVWDCIGPEFLFNILAQDVNTPLRI